VAKTLKYISAAWKVWISSAFLLRKILFLQINHVITIFLYQDTFYNDTRHYSATDYSKLILRLALEFSDEVSEKWDAITSGVLKKRQKDLLNSSTISNVPEF
jgi:hypothetical protein